MLKLLNLWPGLTWLKLGSAVAGLLAVVGLWFWLVHSHDQKVITKVDNKYAAGHVVAVQDARTDEHAIADTSEKIAANTTGRNMKTNDAVSQAIKDLHDANENVGP